MTILGTFSRRSQGYFGEVGLAHPGPDLVYRHSSLIRAGSILHAKQADLHT
jgi:hypothetical protein